MEELRLSLCNYVDSRSHQASFGRSTILWPNPSAAGATLAMASLEMARSNSSARIRDHALKTDMVAVVETTKRTAAELRHPASRYGLGPSGYARANTSGPRMTARRPAGEDIAIRG